MTRPAKPSNSQCPHDSQREKCSLQCKYNFFEAGDLQINSWELKCLDCGWRSTIAYRSDEEDDEDEDTASSNPKQCPFCELCDLKPGINPCDGCEQEIAR